jgi:hypothetical protein
MIEQILLNNNERYYSNFSPTFREMNTPIPKIRVNLISKQTRPASRMHKALARARSRSLCARQSRAPRPPLAWQLASRPDRPTRSPKPRSPMWIHRTPAGRAAPRNVTRRPAVNFFIIIFTAVIKPALTANEPRARGN